MYASAAIIIVAETSFVDQELGERGGKPLGAVSPRSVSSHALTGSPTAAPAGRQRLHPLARQPHEEHFDEARADLAGRCNCRVASGPRHLLRGEHADDHGDTPAQLPRHGQDVAGPTQ